MPHIENHFDAEILAHGHLGDILREAVAAVRKDVGAHFRERAGDAFVGIAFFVVGEDNLVDKRKMADYLGTFLLRHEGKAFLHAEPVVVVHDNDELVAQLACRFKHPHVPDMQGVESTRDGDYAGFPFHEKYCSRRAEHLLEQAPIKRLQTHSTF